MIYSVDYLGLMEQIKPHVFVKYLQDTGWKWLKRPRKDVKVMQIEDENNGFFQVDIPLERALGDYLEAMFMAVKTVAEKEQRPFEQVLLNLLNPNSDILKIRIVKEGVEAGNILLDDAVRLYENSKRLISAAAQDVVRPGRAHYGRQEDSIAGFINQCRFGQTEIGSYVATLVCPFAEGDEHGIKQLSLFSEEETLANSLTRRVTKQIMDRISLIKNNIDQGDYKQLEEDVEEKKVSVNFYKALANINKGVEAEYIAQWSPSVKKNRSENNRILLSKDYVDPLEAVVQKMKDETDKMETYVGQIKQLESSPDLLARKGGNVKLVCLVEGKTKVISLRLDKTDYETAIEAHKTGAYVQARIACKESHGHGECEMFRIIGLDTDVND